MPRHHYLPAVYLGNFSSESKTKLRSRHLFVKDLSNDRIFYTKIENIGCIKNIYTEIVDSIWAVYETDLHKAIQCLINGTLNATTWARILVPFVAGILVRGPEFDARFNKRIEWLKDIPLAENNTNGARIMELQRLLAPMLAANWIVMKKRGKENFIINDNGYIPYRDGPSGQTGYAIPLTQDYILGFLPNLIKPIAYKENNIWLPVIHYVNLDINNHVGFNESSVQFAKKFIYGDSKKLLEKYSKKSIYNEINMPEPGQVGFIDGKMAIIHEFTWHKFVSALESDQINKDSIDFDFNFDVLKNGWCPPLIFPINLPGFKPGLEKIKNAIFVNLYIPPDSVMKIFE
jgi:hypothetical protein